MCAQQEEDKIIISDIDTASESLAYLIWRTEPVIIEIWGVVLYRFIYIPADRHEVKIFFFNEQGNKISIMKSYCPIFSYKDFNQFIKDYQAFLIYLNVRTPPKQANTWPMDGREQLIQA
jgi:hypothetical protein